jgi:hypothetical protein
MIALLWMVNPLWQLILAPGLLIALGWWLRGVADSPHHDAPSPYDWQNEEDYR